MKSLEKWAENRNLRVNTLPSADITVSLKQPHRGVGVWRSSGNTGAPHQNAWVRLLVLAPDSSFPPSQTLEDNSDDSRNEAVATHLEDSDWVLGSWLQPQSSSQHLQAFGRRKGLNQWVGAFSLYIPLPPKKIKRINLKTVQNNKELSSINRSGTNLAKSATFLRTTNNHSKNLVIGEVSRLWVRQAIKHQQTKPLKHVHDTFDDCKHHHQRLWWRVTVLHRQP